MYLARNFKANAAAHTAAICQPIDKPSEYVINWHSGGLTVTVEIVDWDVVKSRIAYVIELSDNSIKSTTAGPLAVWIILPTSLAAAAEFAEDLDAKQAAPCWYVGIVRDLTN